MNFDFTRKKAHVIRIDIAARLILQAYELGLEGRLRGLDLRQRLAALVDVDPTKTPPKLKEIEEKEKKVKARTAAIFKSNGQNQALENIRLYAKSDQDPAAQFIDLAQPTWKTRIIAEVKDQGFSLVIFDLSTLSPSLEDENSAVAWNPLNDLIVALKHEGVASLIVHHTGKGGKEGHRSYRGSSNLATTLETILSLEKVKFLSGLNIDRV